MIANEHEYKITLSEVERFVEALAHADAQGRHLLAKLQRAMRESLESQLQELREELADYEARRGGHDGVADQSAGLPSKHHALVTTEGQ